MSERGSFVTEYIYCPKCLEIAKRILLDKDKYLYSQVLGYMGEASLPIIAGKIGGLYAREEIHTFEFEINKALEKKLCHELRIAVLAEDGERIFKIKPI